MNIDGVVSPGWDSVRQVFEATFSSGQEQGAAVAVYRDGAAVVDLWGGIADGETQAPWERDTVVPVFSTSKGVTALCVHMLVERGMLDLDAPVAQYWPEFAAAGKQDIPVRWLLTHQAGLPVLDADLTFEDLVEGQPVVRALEAQPPVWEPGTAVGYHALTFGHLLGELVRRVTGSSLGRFFADEVADPLGLNAWLGLPPGQTVRLARLERGRTDATLPALPESYLVGSRRAMTLGSAFPERGLTGQRGDMNDRALLAVELGAVNLVSDARSLARLYAAAVGPVEGVRLLTEAGAARASALQVTGGPYWGLPDELAGALLARFPIGLGFILPARLGATSFGHWGMGGSLALGDLDSRVAVAYVMNRMGDDPDPRGAALVDAVRSCLTDSAAS